MSFNPATGRQELILIPTAQEVAMGQGIQASLKKQHQFSSDPAKTQRLQTIGNRIATVSDRKDLRYNFYLVEAKDLNAFTVPGGSVYFHTALFDRLTDDQIAAVLAHEVGHVAAKHTIKKFQAGIGIGLLSTILIEAINMKEQTRRMWRVGAGVSTGLILAAYSRREELEADRLSLKYLRLSGYDPHAMVEALQVLEQEEKKEGNVRIPTVMRTHPYISERIRQLEAQGAKAQR